jgi:RNA polymerase sigma-70 factor, ECF subfamily
MSLTDADASVFETHRGLLAGIAYRMLGSVSDAEDMVEETWLRWSQMDPSTIESPRSCLVTVVSRLCLDRLKSARVQREQYSGTWLPEPFLAETSGPSTEQVDESVSIALLLVLEKLSPVGANPLLLVVAVYKNMLHKVVQRRTPNIHAMNSARNNLVDMTNL